jgi:hypothetical protein
MKKILCLIFSLLMFAGCIKAIEHATGINLSAGINPVMELEMDLVFLDEIAVFAKVNQLLLDRMPVSLEDPWPEVLNYYSKDPAKKEEKAKERYDECLTGLLKYDFFFFRTYNLAAYFGYVGPGGAKAMLARAIIAARGTLIMEAAKEMGRRFEHAKWALSYYPLGCKCPYYSNRFESRLPESYECRMVGIKEGCNFFNRPTEEMLYEYLFSEGGLKSWEDLQIPVDCLRAVEGENLGTFKDVFYTLLPDHIRDNIKRVDDEVNIADSDLESVKARLKEKKLPKAERIELEKREEALEKEVETKIAIQKKLYEEAVSTVEVTAEKVKRAKKLLYVVNFIDDSFSAISAAMAALTIKIVDDMMAFAEFGPQQIVSGTGYLVSQGIASGSKAKERAALLGKRVISLPVNYAEVWGHAVSQKYQVEMYRDYLKALAKMEKKLGK